jgi:hypothetical protein
VRDAVLRQSPQTRSSIAASIEPGTPVRLWPSAVPGEFTGTLRAPAKPGVYRVAVDADGSRADVPLIVASHVARPAIPAPDLLDAWARARGGRAFATKELQQLEPALREAVRPAPRLETWHPMRSAWWIVPFALALSGDWWLRRRRGFP